MFGRATIRLGIGPHSSMLCMICFHYSVLKGSYTSVYLEVGIVFN